MKPKRFLNIAMFARIKNLNDLYEFIFRQKRSEKYPKGIFFNGQKNYIHFYLFVVKFLTLHTIYHFGFGILFKIAKLKGNIEVLLN